MSQSIAETPRERVLKAFHNEKPATLPVGICLGGSWPFWQTGKTLRDLIGDAPATARVFHEVHEKLDVDLLIIGTGSTALMAQALGSRIKFSDKGAPEIEPGALASLEEIEQADAAKVFTDPSVLYLKETARELSALNGDRRFVLASGRAPFTLAANICGLDRISKAIIKDKKFVHRVLELLTEVSIGYYKMMFEVEGVHGAFIADPAASGDVISARHFKEFVIPYLQRVVDAVKQLGKPSMLHICGDITDRLDQIAATGLTSVSLDTKVDLGRARQIVGDRVALAGNVDPVSILEFGTPDQVRSAVHHCRAHDGGGKGLILLPGCDLGHNVCFENIQAFVQAAHNGAGHNGSGHNGVSSTRSQEVGVSEIQKIIEEKKIQTIEAGFGDLQGSLRGKRIPARQFLKILEPGFNLCKAALAWDIQCGIFPIDLVSFDNGYPDLVAKPILESFKEIPWREGSAFVLCDLFDEHGAPLDVAPREVLRRVVAKANALGYRPVIGAELEFYLLNAQRKPYYEGIQCYSLYRGTELEFILKEIREQVEAFGIEVEASNTEYGPAQIEINLVYDDAQAIADKTLLFKNAVKEIARKHGLYATFMAKPWAEESGSGFHVHQSLWDLERQANLFAEDPALAGSYLAGLLATTREFTAFAAPTINSYKRVRDHSFAPINVTWGHDNRTVATRSLLGIGGASRLEQRNGAADANPYLIIAASIAGGLHGIANKLQPPPAQQGDAYLAAAPRLPETLRESLDLLAASVVAPAFFPRTFLEHFLAVGRHEVSVYDHAVTDWERERYLEMA